MCMCMCVLTREKESKGSQELEEREELQADLIHRRYVLIVFGSVFPAIGRQTPPQTPVCDSDATDDDQQTSDITGCHLFQPMTS